MKVALIVLGIVLVYVGELATKVVGLSVLTVWLLLVMWEEDMK